MPVFRPAFTGEGEWWLRMIPLLRSRGLDVEILTVANGCPPGTTLVEGTRVSRIAVDGRRPYLSWLYRVLGALGRRRDSMDLALFHSPNRDAVFASCLAGRLLGWRTVYRMTLLGSDDLMTIRQVGKLGRLRMAALHLAHGYVSMAGAMIRGFERARFLRDRLLTVTQGVDTQRFRPADPAMKAEARASLGLPQEAPIALFCGAIIERKGVDVLIEAWRRVRDQLPDARLLLVGPNHRNGLVEPEYRPFCERIERRIAELGLADSVTLFGYRTDTPLFYAAADLFVFPSRAEGQPNVVAEAMASGLPSVLSVLDGLCDELRDGIEAVVVRSFSPEDYARAIVGLFADREAATRMGERARERSLALFDVERVADRYAWFLRAVGEGRRRPPA
jgi:glycosyltransferase involved in cell wall biosynthesis